MPDIIINRPLTVDDAPALSKMLQSQSLDYMRYFSPFPFDQVSLAQRIHDADEDVYMGIFINGNLAGFFMVRGWDEGYDIPSYGVAIDKLFTGLGLAATSIHIAKTICYMRNVKTLMLKVHPQNVRAKTIYEKAGFEKYAYDPTTQNLVYRFYL